MCLTAPSHYLCSATMVSERLRFNFRTRTYAVSQNLNDNEVDDMQVDNNQPNAGNGNGNGDTGNLNAGNGNGGNQPPRVHVGNDVGAGHGQGDGNNNHPSPGAQGEEWGRRSAGEGLLSGVDPDAPVTLGTVKLLLANLNTGIGNAANDTMLGEIPVPTQFPLDASNRHSVQFDEKTQVGRLANNLLP